MCDLVVHVAGWTRIYKLIECPDILVQIGMWDLVVFTYTNSGVQIGRGQWQWWNTNSYIRYSKSCNSMVSREVETDLLKRYGVNCMAANCLMWIGWKTKNYERAGQW